jgi:NADH-quinone oxidoreductase subunit M
VSGDRTLVLVAAAIGTPWMAAIAVIAVRRYTRAIGFAAALVAVAASGLLLEAAPASASLSPALMLLFSCLTLGATLVLPQRDCRPGVMSGILFLAGATLLAYWSDSLVLMLAGWFLSTVPFLTSRWLGSAAWRPKAALTGSTLALALAMMLLAGSGQPLTITEIQRGNPGGIVVFALLVTAAILRKGIFPAHAWVVDAASEGMLVPTALLLNGHLGAMLVAKLAGPLFPHVPPVLSYLALTTALYAAIRTLVENSPRRILALVALSQSACILAGLESRTPEGVAGALTHWTVVTVSTMGLFGVLRLLEVRFGENLTASHYLGLAEHAPRLAVFFIVFGLALAGLPGTLSFCSQDLLISGTLASHPQTGLLLPLATALNAVSIFRLFARLFLGKRRTGFTAMADALPRERWILTAGVIFVVLGGLYPDTVVPLRPQQREKPPLSGRSARTLPGRQYPLDLIGKVGR